MDDWYLWALAIAALIVAALAWRVPRAAAWVAMGALSFLISGWWHDAGLPYGAAFGAFTNLVIVAALFAYAVLLYELIFWLCFIAMLALDALFLSGVISSHSYFAIGLEIANWGALLSILVAGVAERTGIGLAWLGIFRARPDWAGPIYGRLRHPD